MRILGVIYFFHQILIFHSAQRIIASPLTVNKSVSDLK